MAVALIRYIIIRILLSADLPLKSNDDTILSVTNDLRSILGLSGIGSQESSSKDLITKRSDFKVDDFTQKTYSSDYSSSSGQPSDIEGIWAYYRS